MSMNEEMARVRTELAQCLSPLRGNVIKKVRWEITKKEEITRFRAGLAAHVFSLNMLLVIANM